MAAKSKEELKSEGEKLKSLFAKVKKKQHNFAMLIAKDGIVVEAHIKKSPNILLKAAKKNGGTAKGAWGVMNLNGRTLELEPENDKIPGTLPKLAKKFFSERGVPFKVNIKEPSDGGEDKKEIEKKRKDLAKEFKRISSDIKKALGAEDKTAARDLKKEVRKFMSDLKDKKADLDKMEELEETFEKIKEQTETLAAD